MEAEMTGRRSDEMTPLQRQFLLAVSDCEIVRADTAEVYRKFMDRVAKTGLEADHDEYCKLWSWSRSHGYVHIQPQVPALSSKASKALARGRRAMDQS